MKLYLVLTVGGGDITGTVGKMQDVDVQDARRREKQKRGKDFGGANKKGGKAWILKKKEQMENKGKVVKADSKYTGRKRRTAW